MERLRGLGEGRPVPLLPELRGLAPWVGEVGLRRLATPSVEDPYAGWGVVRLDTLACCWSSWEEREAVMLGSHTESTYLCIEVWVTWNKGQRTDV